MTIEAFVGGQWSEAASLTLNDDAAGWLGKSSLDYSLEHWLKFDPDFSGDVRGVAALSVRMPLDQEWRRFSTWPPFLLDLLPQGHARKALAQAAGLSARNDSNANDSAVLLRAGGSPVGNLRVREAWQAEQIRLATASRSGLRREQILARDERFSELAADAAAIASGSSGVQGAWPKMLLTCNDERRWLPDPMVPDDRASDHAIAKWIGDTSKETRLILESEAPYLELARSFGLRCARPLDHRNGMLMAPRFDRRVENGRVIRCGQESIISAAGIAAFGHVTNHEIYLDVLKTFCDDPKVEVTEYLLRDLLNLAAGNPDNHGRNTALAKDVDGSIRLTPIYDFCPMRLDPTGIARSTRWGCMRLESGGGRDLNPNWDVVCKIVADGVMDFEELRDVVASKADQLRRLPDTARSLGVPDEVIRLAMGRCDELAAGVARRPGKHNAAS